MASFNSVHIKSFSYELLPNKVEVQVGENWQLVADDPVKVPKWTEAA